MPEPSRAIGAGSRCFRVVVLRGIRAPMHRRTDDLALATAFALCAAGCGGTQATEEPVPRTVRAPTAPPPPVPCAAASTTPSASAAVASAPPPAGSPAALRDEVLRSSRAYDLVAALTDEAGARLAGSAGLARGVAWAERTMREVGLANVHTEPVRVPHWERGHEEGAVVAPVPLPLELAALGGSVGTDARGLEAEVVEAASLEALEAMAADRVRGKIVFIDVHTDRARDGAGYGKAVGARFVGATRAAKLGAVGLLIRSIGTDDARLPHTGAMAYGKDVTKIPAAALAGPDADLLHRLVAKGAPVRVRIRLGAKTMPEVDSANVVGEVVGSGAPEQVVLLGAHLDSWDLGRGAVDDGAGCAVVVEAARQIARLAKKPRRTIRVVLFTNEENGGKGAEAYGKAHAAELERHVIALEADTGAGRVYEGRVLGSGESRAAFQALLAPLAPLGVAFSSSDAEGGADIDPLRRAGVPIADLRQDMTGYFDVHHTANDTLDKITRADLDQVAAAFAALALGVADSEVAFGRIPTDKREPRW